MKPILTALAIATFSLGILDSASAQYPVRGNEIRGVPIQGVTIQGWPIMPPAMIGPITPAARTTVYPPLWYPPQRYRSGYYFDPMTGESYYQQYYWYPGRR